MNRSAASMILVLACAGTAYAGDPPAHVKPFLTGDEYNVLVATGAFGPAKDTTVVVTFDMMGAGSFGGFALVPDAKAKDGQRKLALPELPSGSVDGEMRTALIANLDKDASDELVLELKIMETVRGKDGGGFSYGTYTYVVLDWNGKKLVRLAALEKKLAAKMKSRKDDPASALTEDDVRDALGVAKKK